MVKVILFDLYQTLVDVDIQEHIESGWEVIAEDLRGKGIANITAEEVGNALKQQESVSYQGKDKATHHSDILQSLLSVYKQHFSLQLSSEHGQMILWEARQKSIQYSKLYPKVAPVLLQLSQQYILAVASLSHGSITRTEIAKLGIRAYFKRLYFTSEVGFRKTSTQFYSAILKNENVLPQEVIMIGNSYEQDVLTPSTLGIKTIWISHPEYSEPAENISTGMISINDLETLPSVVEEISRA